MVWSRCDTATRVWLRTKQRNSVDVAMLSHLRSTCFHMVATVRIVSELVVVVVYSLLPTPPTVVVPMPDQPLGSCGAWLLYNMCKPKTGKAGPNDRTR